MNRGQVDLLARLGLPKAKRRADQAAARARHPSSLSRASQNRAAVPALTGLLDRAGNPAGASPDRLAMQMAAFGTIGLVLACAARQSFGGVGDLPLATSLALILVVAVAAATAPLVPLLRRARARSLRVAADLPDALDLLALATSAGLALDAAVIRVAAACPGPLGEELTRWQHEVSLGRPRAAALREAARRCAVPELLALAAAIGQAESSGSPLAEAVAAQADVQRQHRALLAEERAQRLPVQLVFPLVLCILPALLVVIVGPAAVSLTTGGALP